jgi:hypothetical protein
MSSPVSATNTKTAPTAPPQGGTQGGPSVARSAAPAAQKSAVSSNPLTSDLDPNAVAKLLESFTLLQKKNKELEERIAAVPTPPPPKVFVSGGKKTINWDNVSEADIFKMDIPVPTIEHALETYLDVHLVDKGYVPRWVHKNQHNIGPKLQQGYSFISKEDLDPNFGHPLEFDTNGHYAFDDVICLKIPKSIYYGKLKSNFNRATSIQRGKEVRARTSGGDVDLAAISDNPYVNAAQQKGAMSFYEPSPSKLTVATEIEQ